MSGKRLEIRKNIDKPTIKTNIHIDSTRASDELAGAQPRKLKMGYGRQLVGGKII